jgi:type I restriction enzyme M protein
LPLLKKTPLSGTLEKRLWDSADQFRANSGLKAQEYSGPILGLIACALPKPASPPSGKLEKVSASSSRASHMGELAAYQPKGKAAEQGIRRPLIESHAFGFPSWKRPDTF